MMITATPAAIPAILAVLSGPGNSVFGSEVIWSVIEPSGLVSKLIGVDFGPGPCLVMACTYKLFHLDRVSIELERES